MRTRVEAGSRLDARGRRLYLTLSDGLVSGIRDFEYGVNIQTSAPISRGSSGGGLFGDRGGRMARLDTGWVLHD